MSRDFHFIPKCGRCCLFGTGLSTVLLITFSFGTIDPREYAIVYDNNFRDIDSEVWQNGRYFTGLGRSFVKFPKGLVTLEFMNEGANGRAKIAGWGFDGIPAAFTQLSCWTENGQQVDIELSMQIRILPDKVQMVYNQWETFDNALWHLQSTIARTIKDASVLIPTEHFFEERETVKLAYVDAVGARLESLGWCALEDFQLREIMLPARFEEAILTKMLTFQMQKKAEFMRQRMLIEESKRQTAANAEMDALETLVNATSEGERIVAASRADGIKDLVVARGSGYAALVDALGFAEQPEVTWQMMNYFIWTRLCPQTADCEKMVKLAGFDSSMIRV